ncbi:MAG: tRNA dihydrouridine synthase DusB [bacterium]
MKKKEEPNILEDILSEQPVIPAPMAGVTDYPFRQILREMKGKLVFTEMVSSKGLIYGNQGTEQLLDFSHQSGHLTGVQLFGEEPGIMGQAAGLLEEKFAPDIIDINMGCPTNKIVKNGAGSALMKDPENAALVIEKVIESVNLPVTVKTRTGWDEKNKNALTIARLACEAGVDAVTVHGRTRNQFYSGKADWEIISEIAREISVPVIGNGDIFTPQEAKKRFEETECSAVMVARGLQGNPWLLKRANEYINKGTLLPAPDYEKLLNMAIYHLQQAVDYFGEQRAVPRMRSHLTWYLKGLPYANKVKDKVNKLSKFLAVKEVLQEYKHRLAEKH